MSVEEIREATKALSFRPLIRGFFFYESTEEKERKRLINAFPSPHSGILFLLQDNAELNESYVGGSFRPLIQGFFFYLKKAVNRNENFIWFPSPHSGILFLLGSVTLDMDVVRKNEFPSPYSGILFL